MAAPTLKQLWKRAPTAPSAAQGGGEAAPSLVAGADADAMMATKEPSQLVVRGDSGSPQKPPAAATADASVTVMVVDDDAVRERKRGRENRERTRRPATRFSKKRLHIDSLRAQLTLSFFPPLSLLPPLSPGRDQEGVCSSSPREGRRRSSREEEEEEGRCRRRRDESQGRRRLRRRRRSVKAGSA